MKNLDLAAERKTQLMQSLADSIRDQDDEKLKAALAEFSKFTSDQVLAEAKEALDGVDSVVLSTRGVRQLTAKEKKYYQALIEAAKSSNPQQAIAGIEEAFPETIITDVINDIQTNHPLLDEVDFVNTSLVTKWVLNAQGAQQAQWGPINSAITKELEGSLKVVDMMLCKLSAYMFLAKDMIDLGPSWIDVYVRRILAEAAAVGLEVAIADGDGKDKPIGMTRDVSDEVTVTGGVYPRKTATKVKEFSPAVYGEILSELTVNPIGGQRPVQNLIMVVNPKDYYKIVMPATTIQTPNGLYANDVLPVPTKIIQSVGQPEGYATIGLAKKYFMGIGTSKRGTIEYSDDFKYLDDLRTYIIKMHGNGMPKDNNAFMLLDISELKPRYMTVNTIPAGTSAGSAGSSGSSGSAGNA